MCKNDFCLKKEGCYRYTAIPDTYQSYILLGEINGLSCEYYMENGSAFETPTQGDVHNDDIDRCDYCNCHSESECKCEEKCPKCGVQFND